MGTVSDPATPQGVGLREVGAVLLLFAVLIAVQLALAGAYSLFWRHFWLDEMYTQRLVADPELTHILAALRGGVETHPPTYYLLLRGFVAFMGNAGETTLRGFALLAALVGLVGAYLALRLTYAPLVALTAVLALWSHPLVQRYAFEARMYGAWLAAAAWFAYALAASRRAGPRPGGLALLAVTSVLLCTLHYFGIIALALMLGTHLWCTRSVRWPALLAAAAGPAALLACTPFLIGQRGAITVATWVKTPDLADVGRFLLSVLLPLKFVVLGVFAGAWWLFRGRRMPSAGRRDLTPVVSLASLALIPVVLILFSFTVQSALVDRYALPATAALAAATAVLVAPLSRPVLLILCALLAAGTALNLHDLAEQYQARDQRTDALIAALRRETGDALVVFEEPHELHPVCRYEPDLAGRCFLLDFEPGQVGPAAPSRIFNRDLARRFAEFYGSPGLVSWERVRSLPRWYLVSEGARELPPDRECYPGFLPRRVDAGLYEVVSAEGK
jgi:hypothetical protein